MTAGRWDVLGISVTEAAHTAKRNHALLKGGEPAIRTAALPAAVIRAPRIVLRLGAAAERCHARDYAERDKK